MTLVDVAGLAPDPHSSIPLHVQVGRAMARAVESGRWAEGEQLPPEPRLGSLLGVSRTTIREALLRLERNGVVHRERGRGTFVGGPPLRTLFVQSIRGFFEEAERAGGHVTAQVLRLGPAILPEWAARALELPLRSPGITLERVRSLDGDVVMYVQNFMPEDVGRSILETDFTSASLYKVMREHHGISPSGGMRTVEAVQATRRVAGLLGLKSGAPVLLIEAATWDQHDRRFECYRAWQRSDRMKLSARLTPGAVP